MQWLKSHREEHGGQYIALDGDQLLAVGSNYRIAREKALAAGKPHAFVTYLSKPDEVAEMGVSRCLYRRNRRKRHEDRPGHERHRPKFLPQQRRSWLNGKRRDMSSARREGKGNTGRATEGLNTLKALANVSPALGFDNPGATTQAKEFSQP
jgi:hypothetical protein